MPVRGYLREMTVEDILALAPDDQVEQAARDLPDEWGMVALVGDEIQGVFGPRDRSYRIRIFVHPLRFTCTCPSRKQPCKHTVGLLLQAVKGDL